jgi:hypothetical protein
VRQTGDYSQTQRLAAVELYLGALASYLAKHPDSGPRQLMKDLPEAGNLLAVTRDGKSAVRLYEQACDKKWGGVATGTYDAARVRQQLCLARQMLFNE